MSAARKRRAARVRLRLCVLGTHVNVEADASLARALQAVFGTFRKTAQSPQASYRLVRCADGFALDEGGRRLLASRDPMTLLGHLESLVAHCALERRDGWVLHAAALVREGGAVVLAGLSGAGKSTLSAALLTRGWRYLSDERVTIDPSLRALGLARPIGLAVGDRIPRGLRRRPHPAQPERLLVHPDPGKVVHVPTPVRLLVSLRHDAQAVPGARALTPGQALTALWTHCALPWPEAWKIALGACSTLPAIELSGKTVAGACDALERTYSTIRG